MTSNSHNIKESQSTPAVAISPSRPINLGSPSIHIRKAGILDTTEDLDLNDEVQLCRVRPTEQHCITLDSASQRAHVASMYHISPHRMSPQRMSTRIKPDSAQEASTEPLIMPKTKSPDETIATPRITKRKLEEAIKDVPLPPAKRTNAEPKKKMVDDMYDATSDSWQDASTEPLHMTPSKVKSPASHYATMDNDESKKSPRKRKLQDDQENEALQVTKPAQRRKIQEQQEIKAAEDKQEKEAEIVSEQQKQVEDDDKKKEDGTMGPPAARKDNERLSKEEEEARIAKEIEYLMTHVRGLSNYYKIVEKIGEGTFSTVYKAQDLRRDLYNNEDWEPQLLNSTQNSFVSPASTPIREGSSSPPSPNTKVLSEFVALKRIYHTSSPKRIANEIEILRKLKGSKCISPLITAFRQQDQVFVVMPYIQHDDFRKTYYDMSMTDIKYYMKSLFTALQQLHKHKILHRDVKPNNFLYNCRKRTGYLIDFGLAETEEESLALEETVQKQAKSSKFNVFAQPLNTTPSNKSGTTTIASSHSVLAQLTNKENRAGSSTSSTSTSLSTSSAPLPAPRGPSRVAGYIRNDPRMIIRANRAGTRGFRAPEVLMRVTNQTCAIDIWAAGVILLCFLTGRFPFFLANDESDALVELTQIFGYKEMKDAATKYNRYFATNLFVPNHRHPWSKLCEVLHKDRIATWDPVDYQNGLDLLNRCLDLDNTTRMTAAEAVEHDFLKVTTN